MNFQVANVGIDKQSKLVKWSPLTDYPSTHYGVTLLLVYIGLHLTVHGFVCWPTKTKTKRKTEVAVVVLKVENHNESLSISQCKLR